MPTFKLHSPKHQGRNEMRGKLMGNRSPLNVFSSECLKRFLSKKKKTKTKPNSVSFSIFPSLFLYFMCLSLSLIPPTPTTLLFHLSVSLAGRCWQQFSQSGPFWQLGQGPGSYQKWHWYKYSQSGERAARRPDLISGRYNFWLANSSASEQLLSFYSHWAVLLIGKNELNVYFVLERSKNRNRNILVFIYHQLNPATSSVSVSAF